MSQVSVALKIYGSHSNANRYVCRGKKVKILQCNNIMIMKAIYPKQSTRLESFLVLAFIVAGDYISYIDTRTCMKCNKMRQNVKN